MWRLVFHPEFFAAVEMILEEDAHATQNIRLKPFYTIEDKEGSNCVCMVRTGQAKRYPVKHMKRLYRKCAELNRRDYPNGSEG